MFEDRKPTGVQRDPSLRELSKQFEIELAAVGPTSPEPSMPAAAEERLNEIQNALRQGSSTEPEVPTPASVTVTTERSAAQGADKATEQYANLLGAGRDTPQNQQSLNFVRSRGDLKTEIAEYRPLDKTEKEELTTAVDERLEELQPLSEEAQEEKQLLTEIKESIEEGKELTEEQKQAITALVDQDDAKDQDQKAELKEAVQSYRPLSQEQTEAFVLAVEESQELTVEQKEELTTALREGAPLSEEQQEMVAEATEELQERILKHDIYHSGSIAEADQAEIAAIAENAELSEEQQSAIDKLLKQDLRVTVEEQATLVDLSVGEKLDEQQQQALKTALKTQALTEEQTTEAIEALRSSQLIAEEDKSPLMQTLEMGGSIDGLDKPLMMAAVEESHARKEAEKLHTLVDKASDPEQVAELSNREIQKLESLVGQELPQLRDHEQAISESTGRQLRDQIEIRLIDGLNKAELMVEPQSDVVAQDLVRAEQQGFEIPWDWIGADARPEIENFYSASVAPEFTTNAPQAFSDKVQDGAPIAAKPTLDLDTIDLTQGSSA